LLLEQYTGVPHKTMKLQKFYARKIKEQFLWGIICDSAIEQQIIDLFETTTCPRQLKQEKYIDNLRYLLTSTRDIDIQEPTPVERKKITGWIVESSWAYRWYEPFGTRQLKEWWFPNAFFRKIEDTLQNIFPSLYTDNTVSTTEQLHIDRLRYFCLSQKNITLTWVPEVEIEKLLSISSRELLQHGFSHHLHGERKKDAFTKAFPEFFGDAM
jgi:hypothetical protein